MLERFAHFEGNFLGGEAGGAHVVDQVPQATGEAGPFLGSRGGWHAAIEDEGAPAPAQVEPAFGGESAVGFGDGVEVDAEVGGELTDGGEGVAGWEAARDEGVAESVGDLAVGGDGGAEVDGEDRGHCILYKYTIQLPRRLSIRRFRLSCGGRNAGRRKALVPNPGISAHFGVTFFHTLRHSRVLNGEIRVALTSQSRLAVSMDESELIRSAQAGDQDAFERLVRGYDQSVLKLAYSLLRSADDAQDIYQEAFLRVHKNLHQFRFDCSFHTWLYRIVTNLCLDLLRKRKVRKEESSVVDTPDGPRDRGELTSDTRATMDPQRALVSGQVRERIDSVLSDLTARERMVFEMRHFEGMRLRAIGEVLGTSEEAAKNCLFRVTQKMRAALGDFV